jgi:hypothetical protein
LKDEKQKAIIKTATTIAMAMPLGGSEGCPTYFLLEATAGIHQDNLKMGVP